jgi:hypothetical protein
MIADFRKSRQQKCAYMSVVFQSKALYLAFCLHPIDSSKISATRLQPRP